MNFSSNYYHFLLEDLPRVVLLKTEADVEVIYTRRKILPKFVHEALNLLEMRLVFISQPRTFSRIYFTEMFNPLFMPSPFASQLVRSAFSSAEIIPAGMRRIYLSRRFSSRPLAKEELVEEWAVSKGFEVIFAESLSFSEQISTFSTSNLVLAPHGAGLANIVFMPEGSTVIEIMSRHYTNPVYETLARPRLRFIRRLFDDEIMVGDKLISELEPLVDSIL